MNNSRDNWNQWLAEFKHRFIQAQQWTEKEAGRRIRDAWAVVRDGRVHVLDDDSQRPENAVPVFRVRTPGGLLLPIEICERLTGLVSKAMASQRSPRDIVLGWLDRVSHADGPDESDEIKQKRHKAGFWNWQLLDACEDETLAGVIGSDAFWQVVLYALQAGRRHAILELYQDPQLLADLIKAQAFQSGKSPGELSRHLEKTRLELYADLGRDPTSREVALAAGGVWSEIDGCWEFNDLESLPSLSRRGLRERLKDIRRRARGRPAAG